MNEIHISAVQEAMNQMMGSSATSMSTIFNRFVNISPPGIDILNMESGEGVSNLPEDETLIQVSFRLLIGDLIDSNLMQLLPVHFAKHMVELLIGGAQESTANTPAPAAPEPVQTPEPQAAAPAPVAPSQPPAQQQMPPQQAAQPPVQDYNSYGQAPMGMPQGMPQGMPPQQPYGMPPQQPYAMPPQPHYGEPQHYGGVPNRNVNVQPVQFANLQNGAYSQVDENNLNLLMDIPLKVTVELGRTQKQIKDILELSQGSIVELDKLAGEPVDILVNNKLIAKGEVVVIDENFGVRVIDIVSQWDRIQKLQ